MNLSICMIVKDEEEHIRDCLNSLPADVEIIIVDTGSTDNTVPIAKMFENVKVIQHKWEDNYAKARNVSLSLATGTHIFVLDADERWTEGCYEMISKHIVNHPEDPAAILIRNIDGSELSSVHRMVRLFPNKDKFRFQGAVHEVLHCNNSPVSYIMTDILIEHYGYNRSNYKEKKYEHYLGLYLKHLESDNRDGYMWYQLGKLHASVEEYEQACEAFVQASEYLKKPSLAHAAMIIEFSKVLKNVALYDDAIYLLETHSKMYRDYPDISFQLGLLYMDVGQLELISSSFKKALSIGETSKYVTTVGVGSYLAAYNLGVFYELTGDLRAAMKYYRLALPYGPADIRIKLITKE